MSDPTEAIRRQEVDRINSEVESDNPDTERSRLESIHGEVYDTAQLKEKFEVENFMAPCVIVRRKSDNKKGLLEFQHNPRFYFNFMEY
jgi:hypothetical protein